MNLSSINGFRVRSLQKIVPIVTITCGRSRSMMLKARDSHLIIGAHVGAVSNCQFPPH